MAVILPSVYKDGTATIAANGTAVTGQNTLWVNSVLPGDFFGVHKGYAVRIATVNSNTSLTLANPWPGSAQTTAAYEIMLQSDNARMQETSRQLLQTLSNGNIASLGDLTTAADTLAYYNGPGTSALTPFTSFGRSLVGTLNASAAYSVLGTIPNAQLPTRLRSASTRIADWDTALESGFYFGDDTTLNTPTQLFSYVGVVTAYTPTYLVQRLVAVGNPSPVNNLEFVRQRDNGTFGPWGRVRSTQAEMDSLYNAKLNFTPVRQGGSNNVILDWQSDGRLGLQIDTVDFSDRWPINIIGNVNDLGTQSSLTDHDTNKLMRVGGFGFGGRTILLGGGDDLNNLGDQSTLYHWWDNPGVPNGAPDTYCTMQHFVHSNGAYTQTAYSIGGVYVYQRGRNGAAWSAWKRIDGDVSGPASATDGYLAAFNGTTGKLLKQQVLSTFASTILDDTSGAAMFATMGATQSIAVNGYTKLPNGLIIQWGQATSTGGNATIALPMAFPNAVFSVTASCSNPNPTATVAYIAWADTFTLTNFILRGRYAVPSGVANENLNCSYIAIGY